MRSMTKSVVLLFVFLAPGSLVHAQGTEPADKTGVSPSTVATEEEVSQLRSEVAAQQKTIEELKNDVVVSPVKDEEQRCRVCLHGSGRRAGLVNPVTPQLEA